MRRLIQDFAGFTYHIDGDLVSRLIRFLLIYISIDHVSKCKVLSDKAAFVLCTETDLNKFEHLTKLTYVFCCLFIHLLNRDNYSKF